MTAESAAEEVYLNVINAPSKNRDASLQVLSAHAELMNSLVHNTSINEQDKTLTSHLLLIIQISNVNTGRKDSEIKRISEVQSRTPHQKSLMKGN